MSRLLYLVTCLIGTNILGKGVLKGEISLLIYMSKDKHLPPFLIMIHLISVCNRINCKILFMSALMG